MKHHLMKLLLLITFSGLNTQPSLDAEEDLVRKISSVAQLPKELDENCSLQYVNDYFWNFNDSPYKAELYNLDPSSGRTLQKFQFSEAKNQDWQYITCDNKYLYVADISNNCAGGKDLTIYRINISQIGPSKKTKFPVESIRFRYSKQKTFKYSYPMIINNLDTETLFYQNEKFHILSKDWRPCLSTNYTVSTEPDNYKVNKIETFDAEDLINAANIKNNQAVTVRYTKIGLVFLWKYWNFKNEKYFNG